MAWFADSTPEMNNIFHFADFEIEVSHRLDDGTWAKVESDTEIFNKEALYEPGYVQIVYLKVENKGSTAFDFYTAVNVNDCSVTTNVFGQKFLLQDYLKFGITNTDSEKNMENSISDYDTAVKIANMPLHNYYEAGAFRLEAEQTKYIALAIRMPEEVGNVANYREDAVPKIGLGITVKAEQITG